MSTDMQIIIVIISMVWAIIWTIDAIRQNRRREKAEEIAQANYEAAEWYAEQIPFGRGSWPKR